MVEGYDKLNCLHEMQQQSKKHYALHTCTTELKIHDLVLPSKSHEI